jgi:HPt (histidine-containing phosphotransfer) domain-containing protein
MATTNNIHLESIRSLCGTDPTLVEEMLHVCLSQCEETKNNIMSAYVTNDVAALVWVLHKVKPMVHYLGAHVLADELGKLEVNLKQSGFWSDDILSVHRHFDTIGISLKHALAHQSAA